MLIRDLLDLRGVAEMWSVGPHTPLTEMAAELHKRRIGALVVLDSAGELIGVASERDLVAIVARHAEDLPVLTVADVMTRKVTVCTLDDDIMDTLAVMTEKRIRHIPVVVDGRPHAMISIREFDAACQELQTLASTDPLTGLANRRHLMTALEKELNRHRRFDEPLSVAMLDIDHFKRVNDTYGHDAGDDVLRAIGHLMVKDLRAYDIIGRLGGEEFAILLPNTDFEDGVGICERLRALIGNMVVDTDAGAIRITSSFGMICTNGRTESARGVLKKVDELLYEAKGAGRNRVMSKLIDPPRPTLVPIARRNVIAY
ncbi:MAG: GGDEF domain-containing protein [Pseudomonadota bacterium]